MRFNAFGSFLFFEGEGREVESTQKRVVLMP